MKKRIRIVKKGQDRSNLNYWMSLSSIERLIQLEAIRRAVNKYGTQLGFQRVYRVVKRA